MPESPTNLTLQPRVRSRASTHSPAGLRNWTRRRNRLKPELKRCKMSETAPAQSCGPVPPSEMPEPLPRTLVVDVANFTNLFFGADKITQDPWRDLANASQRIKRFVAAAQKGFRIIGVLPGDVGSRSQADRDKWYARREKELETGRRAILAIDELGAELLVENGVNVWKPIGVAYKDVIAALASKEGSTLLSRDSTFRRYEPRLRIASGWRIDASGKLSLQLDPSNAPAHGEILRIDPSLGDVTKLGATYSPSTVARAKYQPFLLPDKGKLLRGVSSSSDKPLGSLYLLARPLRQAVYARLGEPGPVEETIPIWSQNKVVWATKMVLPDAKMDHLLDNPVGMAMWLSEHDKKFEDLSLPDATRLTHERGFNTSVLAAEIHCAAMSNKPEHAKTMIEVLRMMPQWATPVNIPDSEMDIVTRQMERAAFSDRPARTVACRDCGQDFGMTAGEVKFYEEKGMELPSRCKACREAKKSGGWMDNSNRQRDWPRDVRRAEPPASPSIGSRGMPQDIRQMEGQPLSPSLASPAVASRSTASRPMASTSSAPASPSIERVNQEARKVDCRDCGAEFSMSPGEVAYFAEKGLELPIRCAACRQKKREQAYERPQREGSFGPGSGRGDQPARTSSFSRADQSANWRRAV